MGYLHWDESQSLRDDLVLSTSTLPNEAGVFELTKLEHLLKDDPQMEWYYDYATGQLHNGIGWNYDSLKTNSLTMVKPVRPLIILPSLEIPPTKWMMDQMPH